VTVARPPLATRDRVAEGQRDIFDEMVKSLGSARAMARGVMTPVPKAHRWATGLNSFDTDLPPDRTEPSLPVRSARTKRGTPCEP
jgi:hypothetical protein